MVGTPKKFEKNVVEKHYKLLRMYMAKLLNIQDVHLVESTAAKDIAKRFKDDKKRENVKKGVKAFHLLHELIFDIGELFFDLFVFAGRKERVWGVGKVKIEDWSDIKGDLRDFIDFWKKTYKENREIQQICNKIEDSVDSIDDVFRRLFKELHP